MRRFGAPAGTVAPEEQPTGSPARSHVLVMPLLSNTVDWRGRNVMGLRYRVARYAALLLTAAMTMLVTGLPAAAGTTGEFISTTVAGAAVKIDGQSTRTSLLGLRLEDGKALDTYCVELDVNGRVGARLAESPWSEYPDAGEQFNAHPEMVLWILHNSYPNVGVDALNEKLGTSLD